MNTNEDEIEDEETLEQEVKRIQREDGERPSLWDMILGNEDRRYWV